MVRVSQCCCGCSLRTGTLILLWLSLVGSILTAIKYMGTVGSIRNGFGELFCYYNILSSLLLVLLSALALWGINEKKPEHMMPYIGFSIFGIILGCLFLLVFPFNSTDIINSGIVDNTGVDAKSLNQVAVLITFALALGLALEAYFTVVVYSYYCTLKEQEHGAGGIIRA